MDIQEVGLTEDKYRWRKPMKAAVNFRVPLNARNFLFG